MEDMSKDCEFMLDELLWNHRIGYAADNSNDIEEYCERCCSKCQYFDKKHGICKYGEEN